MQRRANQINGGDSIPDELTDILDPLSQTIRISTLQSGPISTP
jgi:hypothetical protein